MRNKYLLQNINEEHISLTQYQWDKNIVDSWKIFYILEDIVKWISLTLIFYIKSYKNK
jgi:hypothetical protein